MESEPVKWLREIDGSIGFLMLFVVVIGIPTCASNWSQTYELRQISAQLDKIQKSAEESNHAAD